MQKITENAFFASLDYNSYPELSAVKSAVEHNNFTLAKTELVKYYKRRNLIGTKLGFEITASDENYKMAVLPMRNILTGPCEFDMWQGEFRISGIGIYSDYEIDVTDRIISELSNGAVSFMLFASKKNTDKVLVNSNKSKIPPKLSIVLENSEHTIEIPADKTTYISSKNPSVSYENASELIVYEDGSECDSTGTETTRGYINFPLDKLINSKVISAKLIISARLETPSSDCAEILVINIGDTVWSENTMTWSNIQGNIYSYENSEVPFWNASAPNCDSEYHNVTARFWFGKPMVYEYLSYLQNPDVYNASHPYSAIYCGKSFGDKLIDLMSAFASQMNYGYPRTLETGERLNRWVDIVDALLPTGIFDNRAEDFYKIISFIKGDCDYLSGLDIANSKYWWSNWRVVANAGFFKAAEYLREFNTHAEYRTKAEHNINYSMNLLYNDDMSFTEAGPSYAQWCTELFTDCALTSQKCGNPMNEEFITKLIYAARYAANSFFPDGFDSNIGDSNYRCKLSKFRISAEFLNDPVLNAYVNGDSNYRDCLSAIYPNSNSAYMRTGWNSQESVYISFINNPYDGHYHPDSNQILMYAYGQPLLVDSGRYSYSSVNNIYNELRTAAAHNTIEAVNVNMSNHSTAANKMEVLADNHMFTLVSSTQNGYINTSHTRTVLFFKNVDLPALVTDYITSTKNQTFRQNWHFMPSGNVKANKSTVSTAFYEKGNISIATAGTPAHIRDGYFSSDYGLVTKSKYASYEKSGTEVKFSTVLLPMKPHSNIILTATDTARNNASSAVNSLNMNFYVRHTPFADNSFNTYTTDAQAAFIGNNIYGIVNGTSLKSDIDYIRSSVNVRSIGVIKNSGNVTISIEVLSQNEKHHIKLYAPCTRKVTLNGKEIKFLQDGNYIYLKNIFKQ